MTDIVDRESKKLIETATDYLLYTQELQNERDGIINEL